MRILHTIPDVGWAGREERILETCLWQAEHGHEVSIAAPRDNELHSRGSAKGLTVLDFPIHPTAANIENLCEMVRADIIDSHGARDTTASAHASLSIPVVHTRHCLLRDEDLTAHQRIAWNRLDHVIATANAIKLELIDRGAVYSRRVSVVGEWVLPKYFESPDAELIEKTCLELGIDNKNPVIALVSMLRKEKGFDVLLHAAAQVCQRVPGLQILIVGGATATPDSNHMTAEEMQSLVQDAGLSDRVIYTGFREDVNVLMRCANFLIVPSVREAQSRVIPQAFASGLPVIASLVGGIPELIKDGETGWLVPSNQPTQLAERLIACLDQPALRDDVVLNAKQFAKEKLDLESKMHQTIEVYTLTRQRHGGNRKGTGSVSVSATSRPVASTNPFVGLHVMLVVAHPDDETLGAGIAISKASRLTLVHVTDGAESDEQAKNKGFSSRAEYASERAAELRRALAMTEVNVSFINFGVRDQRAAFNMADLALSLGKLMESAKPDVIVTHAFEGAHPDHDATACAVHMAHKSLDSSKPLYELTGYHSAGGKDVYGEFIPNTRLDQITYVLSPKEQALKKAMLDAFSSQRNIIPCFPLASESFRLAPKYDFSVRPHDGPLYYERHKSKMTWRIWHELVRQASQSFRRRLGGEPDWSWLSRNVIEAKYWSGLDKSAEDYLRHWLIQINARLNGAIDAGQRKTTSAPAAPPMDQSMQTILNRLIEKIDSAVIDSVPTENIYMEELFEPAIYSEIVKRLPADSEYDDIVHRDAVLPDGRISRKLLDLTNESINRIHPANRRFWLRMKAILTSEELLQAILKKFSNTLDARFGAHHPRLLIVPVLYRDYAGYRISIHPDIPAKVATLQLYLPEDEAQIHLGTTFHIKEGERFREHKTNPFKPNSAYAFVRTDNSWHSVKELGQQEKIRNSLALTVYIAGQQFKSQARNQGLLQQLLQCNGQIQLLMHLRISEIWNGVLEQLSFLPKQISNTCEDQDSSSTHNVNAGVNPRVNYEQVFDSKWYLSQNPDVEKTAMDPLSHYLKYGVKHGRDPSPFFDSSWYLNQYPDVAESGMNPLAHYLLHGAKEGRDPSPLFCGQLYLTQCPDVAALGMNPLVHYLQHGRYETRMANIQLQKLEGSVPYKFTANRFDEFNKNKPVAYLDDSLVSEIIFKPNFTPPEVSIIVPVGAQLHEILQCLWALSQQKSPYSYEVIAVGDSSTNEIGSVISSIAGLQYRQLESVLTFVSCWNFGATLAAGRYLVFLRDDTEVLPGWLTELISTFDKHIDAGLISSKLLHANGQLQDIDEVVGVDGACLSNKSNGDPDSPRYNFLRSISYCLETAIAMKKETFQVLNGFDDTGRTVNSCLPESVTTCGGWPMPSPREMHGIAPARMISRSGTSYLGVDLVSRIRSLGLNALYQPFACCIGKGNAISRPDVIAGAAIDGVFADKPKSKLRALFLDADMPMSERDARLWNMPHLFELLSRQGYACTFVPANLLHAGHYTYQLQKLGVECWYKPYVNSVEEFLRDVAQNYDVICIFEEYIFNKYGKLLNELFPLAQIVMSYDQALAKASEDH